MKRRTRTLLFTAAALGAPMPMAGALMTSTVTASQPFATAALAAPADVATEPGTCQPGVADSAVVTWTPPSPTKATAYEVLRAASSEGPYTVIATVSGATADEYEDTGLDFDAVYSYRVRSITSTWHSAPSAAATRATRSAACS